MLPVRLWFVRDLGDVLFLGLLLLFLIRCVRAGFVLPEVANELGVNSNGSSDDAHDILCKRAGLVGTDDGGIRHRLTRTKDTDKKFFGGHPLRSEGEREGDSERETFWNGYDNKCYRDDEYLGEGDALLASGTMKTSQSG